MTETSAEHAALPTEEPKPTEPSTIVSEDTPEQSEVAKPTEPEATEIPATATAPTVKRRENPLLSDRPTVRARKIVVLRKSLLGAAAALPPFGGAEPTPAREPRREATETEEQRPEAIHVHGTDRLATDDLFAYFADERPIAVEWICDSSCNVVFDSAESARGAIEAHAVLVDSSKQCVTISDDAMEVVVVSGADDASAVVAVDGALPWRKLRPLRKPDGTEATLVARTATAADVRPTKPKPSAYYAELAEKGLLGNKRGRDGETSATTTATTTTLEERELMAPEQQREKRRKRNKKQKSGDMDPTTDPAIVWGDFNAGNANRNPKRRNNRRRKQQQQQQQLKQEQQEIPPDLAAMFAFDQEYQSGAPTF